MSQRLVIKAGVIGGPQEANIAVYEESVRRYYANESDDPSQVVERRKEEERILEEW